MYIEKNTYGWNFTPFSAESGELLEEKKKGPALKTGHKAY